MEGVRFLEALGDERAVAHRHAPALAAPLRIFVSIFTVLSVGTGLDPGVARAVTPLAPLSPGS